MWDKFEVGICVGNIEIIDFNGWVMLGKEQCKCDLFFCCFDFDDLFLDCKLGLMVFILMFWWEVLEKVGGFDLDICLEDVYIELVVIKVGYVIDIFGEVFVQYCKYFINMYKNVCFMVDNVFKMYSQFSDYFDYEQVIMCFCNLMFFKCLNWDKVLVWELFFGLLLKYWNEKIFCGIVWLFFFQFG